MREAPVILGRDCVFASVDPLPPALQVPGITSSNRLLHYSGLSPRFREGGLQRVLRVELVAIHCPGPLQIEHSRLSRSAYQDE